MKEHTIIYGEEGHTILLEGPLLIGKDDSAVDTIIRCVKEVGDCAKNAKSAKTQSLAMLSSYKSYIFRPKTYADSKSAAA